MNTIEEANQRPLRVLHLEDNPHDCELIASTLKREGLICEMTYAHCRNEFETAITQSRFDLIISDYTMPAYDGAAALVAARQNQPDTPFLFVSGTIGEDRAVENLKGGATDYVLKDRLGRLGRAVRRALGEAAERLERRRAEEALRESEEKYRDLFENANDLIQNVTPDGRLLYVNRAWRETLGYGEEDWPVLSVLDIVHPDRRKDWEELICLALTDQPIKIAETEFVARDGRRIALEGSVSPKRVKEVPVSLRCIFRDVTEKKILEARFLRNQRLESIGTLAGGIAHDLNNALAPILMSLELLRLKFPDAESGMLLDTIAGSARRGAEMVKQVLTFSRGLEGQRGRVQIRHLLKEIQSIVKQTFPKFIHFENQMGRDLWPVMGDATQMHQVLLNLCINARDAMPSGGTLSLRTENVTLDETFCQSHPGAQPGAYLLIQVSDTGMGIEASIRNRIFDPFFTTKAPGKGTGLGLSNVRAIVKGHEGLVLVESELNRGSTFKVYFPAKMDLGDSGSEPGASTLPMGRGETILLVDDEASVCDIARQTLEMFGYAVLTAADGAQAVALCAQYRGKIDLMLTDMAMPVMDGAATIRAVRDLDPGIRIIAVSGNSVEMNQPDIARFDADGYLQKPFTAEALLKVIRQVLDRKLTPA